MSKDKDKQTQTQIEVDRIQDNQAQEQGTAPSFDNNTAPASAPAPVPAPEVIDNIEFNILELVERYKQSLEDPEELKENNGLFVDMLKYIYKYYVSLLLDNKYHVHNRYDYELLNTLFDIYTHLVYNYKKNYQPNIIEFCIFINIDRSVLYDIKNGYIKKATMSDIRNVKRWFSECENSLVNGSGVAEIFKLKAMYGYNDNLAAVPIELQQAGASVQELPDLSKLNAQKLLSDPDTKQG